VTQLTWCEVRGGREAACDTAAHVAAADDADAAPDDGVVLPRPAAETRRRQPMTQRRRLGLRLVVFDALRSEADVVATD